MLDVDRHEFLRDPWLQVRAIHGAAATRSVVAQPQPAPRNQVSFPWRWARVGAKICCNPIAHLKRGRDTKRGEGEKGSGNGQPAPGDAHEATACTIEPPFLLSRLGGGRCEGGDQTSADEWGSALATRYESGDESGAGQR